MAGRANLQDGSALLDLQNALATFRDEAHSVLLEASSMIRDTQAYLEERREYWQSEVAQCESEYYACCSYSDDDGRGRDCSAEAAALRQAEEQLENVNQWQAQVDIAVESHESGAANFRGFLDSEISRASSYLGTKLATVDAYSSSLSTARQSAVHTARKQEVELVQNTGRGTRDWSERQVRFIQRKGILPKGYQGHHINNVSRFPLLAGESDNIVFVTRPEHFLGYHRGDWHNNTSGKMFNRKSLMQQWGKYK